MENILIVTGGSKGIGAGIVEAYLKQQYRVFSLSRSRRTPVDDSKVTTLQADLSDVSQIDGLLARLFSQIDARTVKRLVLVNNAGTLGEIGQLENITPETIPGVVALNLVAPMLLIGGFLRITRDWTCERKVINISSGAAQQPYAGWSVYCATKAGLDMLSRTVAAEQDSLSNGAKIIAVYPGVVDTAMQSFIRQHDKADFASIDRFLALKASGELADPKTVGAKIWELDQSDLANGTVTRLT